MRAPKLCPSVVLLTAMLSSSSGCHPPRPPSGDACFPVDVRAEVVRAVQRFAAAFRAGDVDTIESLLHERYVHTNGGNRPLSREAWITWFRDRSRKMKSGEIEVLSYEVRDLEVAVVAGSAVVTGWIESATRVSGASERSKIRFTNVWACEHGRWMRVAFHDAPAVEPR
jgi:ketosteroid isomerase-like protein